jgi:hypothetical protein
MHSSRPARLSLLGGIVVAALMPPQRTADAVIADSVTGAGQFAYTSDDGVTAWRTFALQAHTASEGIASGQAEVKNRATDQTLHIRIDCLNVIGNVAVISGVATSATGPGNSDGDPEIFAVEDNGQGAAHQPDRVTRAFGNSGLICTDITPADLPFVSSLLRDIEAGNIQIR